MLKKHDLGITPYIENISSRDQSLVRMGTSRVTLGHIEALRSIKSHKTSLQQHKNFEVLVNEVSNLRIAS